MTIVSSQDCIDIFHVIGLKYGACSSSLREKLFIDEHEIQDFSKSLYQSIQCEILVVSTCDRVEFYFLENNIETVTQIIFRKLALDNEQVFRKILAASYKYSKHSALQHLFRVTAALDSHIIGEPQIFGQIRSSHRIGKETGTIRSQLNNFLEHAYFAAKRVRKETNIGQGPVTIAAAAIRVARDINGDLAHCKAAIFGNDEATIFLSEHFKAANLSNFIFINENTANSDRSSTHFVGEIANYDETAKILVLVDIAIISANSLNYAITKEMMTSIIKKRHYKPLFIIDVGVPSVIDPAIEDIDEVFLYNLDDLEQIALKGKNQRGSALIEAEQIIDEELERFTKKIKGKNIEPLLKAIINSMNQERLEVLREKPNLSSEAVSQLLVNRLVHIPITAIKELYTKEELDERTELLIRKLFTSTAKWKGDPGEF